MRPQGSTARFSPRSKLPRHASDTCSSIPILGNVVSFFDRQRRVSDWGPSRESLNGATSNRIHTPLNDRYERGKYRRASFTTNSTAQLARSPTSRRCFTPSPTSFGFNYSLLPVDRRLKTPLSPRAALSPPLPLGRSSCSQGYRILFRVPFPDRASYEIEPSNPEPKMYQAAAKLPASLRPTFSSATTCPATIQQPESAGFDAVQYTTTPKLVADMRRPHGLKYNY